MAPAYGVVESPLCTRTGRRTLADPAHCRAVIERVVGAFGRLDIPRHMEDGSPVPPHEQCGNIDRLLEEWRPEPLPEFRPALQVPVGDGVTRPVCCAGPYFALVCFNHRFDTPAPIRFIRSEQLELGERRPRPRSGNAASLMVTRA